MDVKIVDKNKEKFKFLISDISHEYANSFRRFMAFEVPTMAIEDIEFRANSGILYDEMVSHRVGLVPLTTDLKSYKYVEKDPNMEDPQVALKLTLVAEGPKVVTTADLKSKDPKVKPVHDNMPIAKLLEGQRIEFEATAILGLGKDHAKFSPGLIHYSPDADITVNNASKEIADFKDKYPPQIFDKAGKIDKKLITKPSVIEACIGVNDSIVKIKFKEDDYVFHVEPWGQLDARSIVTTAIDVFDAQLKELKGLFASL